MNKLKKENEMFIIDRPVSHGLKYYAKYSILIVLDIFYKILLLFTYKKSPNKKYNISICAIFKNEANYMKEWIEFHQMMGVDHFYLYNNNSADDYFSVLSQYIEKGIVTLVEWPEVPGQLTAYKNWYEKYRFETKWAQVRKSVDSPPGMLTKRSSSHGTCFPIKSSTFASWQRRLPNLTTRYSYATCFQKGCLTPLKLPMSMKSAQVYTMRRIRKSAFFISILTNVTCAMMCGMI